MAIVRLDGFDSATGKEHTLTTGDTIENFGGIVAGVNFKGAIPDVGSFPAEIGRVVGDMWTVTAVAAITDPEGTGQTLQPGDEVIWDGTQWVVIGNALLPNVEAALLTVLAADEDLLIRIGGVLGALNVGAIGNVLQVVDAGGGTPQVAWGGAPAGGGGPSAVVDYTATPSPAVIPVGDVNKVIIIPAVPAYTVVLPDPTALNAGDEIHVRHPSAALLAGVVPAFPIGIDIAAGIGTFEGQVAGGPAFNFAPFGTAGLTIGGGVTLRVTDDGVAPKDWKIVGDWTYENAVPVP